MRLERRTTLAASVAGLLCVIVACTALAGGRGEAQLPTPGGEELGKNVYVKICAECHGPSGQGDGPKAKKLGFYPRDFSLGAFKCRCTPTGQPPTDEDLFRTVTVGLPGTPMLAQGKTLGEAERRAVVAYIKRLSPKFNTGNAVACGPLPSPPPPSPRLVADGKQLYRLMQCGKCHGATGRGDGPAAPTLKDDWGRPIKPYNFVITRNFKCGNDDRDLYRTLRTGLTGTPMPSYESAMLFSRDDFSPAGLQALGDAGEIKELAEYLQNQPDAAAQRAMSPQDKAELSSARTWALVNYVRSLLAK